MLRRCCCTCSSLTTWISGVIVVILDRWQKRSTSLSERKHRGGLLTASDNSRRHAVKSIIQKNRRKNNLFWSQITFLSLLVSLFYSYRERNETATLNFFIQSWRTPGTVSYHVSPHWPKKNSTEQPPGELTFGRMLSWVVLGRIDVLSAVLRPSVSPVWNPRWSVGTVGTSSWSSRTLGAEPGLCIKKKSLTSGSSQSQRD